jgi:outer membrane protein assembly factor BamB
MREPVLFALLIQLAIVGTIAADSAVERTEAAGRDWPQWRGVNRDGLSAETGLVREFPEGGPEVLWRIKAGDGYSSVSVVDDKLYTMWDEQGKQFLFCLDALTGKELWRHELGAAFTNHYGNGPRSTPLVDGGVVYAVGTNGLLLAANRKTGRTLWQHDLAGEYRSKLPSYGFSSSPLVVGNKLVVEAGGKNATYIAFDKKNGEVAWTSGSDRPAYSSPIISRDRAGTLGLLVGDLLPGHRGSVEHRDSDIYRPRSHLYLEWLRSDAHPRLPRGRDVQRGTGLEIRADAQRRQHGPATR